MDRFEGRCRLEWWANSSTLLCSAEVAVVIESTDGGWQATGRLAGLGEAEREGFDFVCELDPVFTLRFDDDSTIPVAVEGPDPDGRPQRRTAAPPSRTRRTRTVSRVPATSSRSGRPMTHSVYSQGCPKVP